MTEPTPTDIPKINVNADETIEEIKRVVAEGMEALKNPQDPNVVRAKETFGKYQALIFTGLGIAVVYKLNKRAIRKVVAKEILTGLATTPVIIDIPAYMKDLDAFYTTEAAARAAGAWAKNG